jgi:hypothetical protein
MQSANFDPATVGTTPPPPAPLGTEGLLGDAKQGVERLGGRSESASRRAGMLAARRPMSRAVTAQAAENTAGAVMTVAAPSISRAIGFLIERRLAATPTPWRETWPACGQPASSPFWQKAASPFWQKAAST